MNKEGSVRQSKNIFAVFFIWWYLEAPKDLLNIYKDLLFITIDYFSLPVLVKTLFKPWKRIYTPKGKGLPGIIKSWQDNAVSRFVGFSVRVVFIFLGLISIVLVVVGEFLFFVFWLMLPFLTIFSLFLSVKTLLGG